MNEEPTATLPGVAAALHRAAERSQRITRLVTAELGPDASRWKQDCPECGDGSRALNLTETTMASHEDLTLVWDPCPECALREKLHLAGVPKNLTHATLGNWRVAVDKDEDAITKAREFCRKPSGFLILSGEEYGNGKSHLAVATMREAVVRRLQARFVTAAEFMRSVRKRYDDPKAENIVDSLKRVPFLVVDEYGATVTGKDEAPTFHELLDDRYGDRRPTVITMNLSPEVFREAIGPRMANRLREATFAWATVHGPSYRAGNRREYLRQK